VHVPHWSDRIPETGAGDFVLSAGELLEEKRRLTDWHAEDLFDPRGRAEFILFPVSRMVVDPERFADDALEPMALKGMGAVYTRTSDGAVLRRRLSRGHREKLLRDYYYPHHEALAALAREALSDHGKCLIMDGHSFPSRPLPCDLDQAWDRPDICIGTDGFHTPDFLCRASVEIFEKQGWSVAVNRPYSGALVPLQFYERDKRVLSVMVELNRSLYMDEETLEKKADYLLFRRRVRESLKKIRKACGFASNEKGKGKVHAQTKA
jgi:N-formylglutamate amidohydrolase